MLDREYKKLVANNLKYKKTVSKGLGGAWEASGEGDELVGYAADLGEARVVGEGRSGQAVEGAPEHGGGVIGVRAAKETGAVGEKTCGERDDFRYESLDY